MVDPDGVDLVLNGPPPEEKDELIKMNKGSTDFSGWKANIRGVDLNNQFPANWEIEKQRKGTETTGSEGLSGRCAPHRAGSNRNGQFSKKQSFSRVLAFHTQGKEFYWGYEQMEPPESEFLACEFAKESGYRAVRFIDSHAGFKDWFIQEYRKPGFTIELGEGVNPLPLSQYEEIYEDVLGLFWLLFIFNRAVYRQKPVAGSFFILSAF